MDDQPALADARGWRERASRLLEASDLPVLLDDHAESFSLSELRLYAAVVDHDVMTPEAFLAWQATNRLAE